MSTVRLDDVDKEILRILQKEGRISNKDLAERINLTTTPTLERVRRLEREGVISGYEAKVNPETIDLGLNAFVTITLSAHRLRLLDEFTNEVKAIPEILACYNTTGDGDFLLHIVAKDVEDYERIMRTKLATLPDVQRMYTSIVLNVIKEQTNIPIP
ncbi:MAG: Lrp/AsnC family transcriptional regulator [Balneolaceae bacterium]|nr:Lrp/AsnC family transcriptional regulator [Balneolaceae bacterium]